ncbi:glycosyltransferase [Aestuariimicrobium sp. Y1814]|uniref:glycosyltransferase n=1 Tax=Aestuariimicrobium sp. Y1814 TaxID=3418742 RepID=UPI003DA70C35
MPNASSARRHRRVLLATAGSRGDVEPFFGLAAALQDAGHEVRVTAPDDPIPGEASTSPASAWASGDWPVPSEPREPAGSVLAPSNVHRPGSGSRPEPIPAELMHTAGWLWPRARGLSTRCIRGNLLKRRFV